MDENGEGDVDILREVGKKALVMDQEERLKAIKGLSAGT